MFVSCLVPIDKRSRPFRTVSCSAFHANAVQQVFLAKTLREAITGAKPRSARRKRFHGCITDDQNEGLAPHGQAPRSTATSPRRRRPKEISIAITSTSGSSTVRAVRHSRPLATAITRKPRPEKNRRNSARRPTSLSAISRMASIANFTALVPIVAYSLARHPSDTRTVSLRPLLPSVTLSSPAARQPLSFARPLANAIR